MSLLSAFISHNIILTAALAFGLGMWVYFDRRRDPRNITLGSLLVAVAFWSFSFVLWRVSDEPRQALFWAKTIFFIGSLLPALYLLFCHALLNGRLPSSRIQALCFLPNAVLLPLIYHTQAVLTAAPPGGTLTFGWARAILAAHFAVFIIASLVVLLIAAKRNAALDRTRITSVLVGTIIAFNSIFAVLFGSTAHTSPNAYWMGNVALMTGMFIIAVAIIKNRLLVDLRLVSAEVFILLTLFVIVADIVVSQSMLDFSLRLAILVVLVFYGTMTSRNIVREARNLHELQALTEHVTKMNGQLLEADRTKTKFLSLATHQLRAPLGGMRSYLDMLFKGNFGPLTDKQQDIVRINLGATSQLLETVEMFLNVTKIELGKLELYKSETLLQKLFPRVIEGVQPLADRKGLAIAVDIPQNARPVFCDSGKIFHVLMNLLDNAIKYTEKGEIRLSASFGPDEARVSIKDTGAGLSPEDKERLFEGFKRGIAGATLNKDGSGLGLFLVKNIVEAHNGKVFVESEGRGCGSTFGFTLPMVQA
jgi:signal transduction histidine kinase